jgi:hypothetical protein
MRALLNDDGVRRGALHPVADRVAAAMRAGAPRETGALAESVTVWDDTTDRAAVRVGSRLHYAAAIEAGTGFMSRAVGGA